MHAPPQAGMHARQHEKENSADLQAEREETVETFNYKTRDPQLGPPALLHSCCLATPATNTVAGSDPCSCALASNLQFANFLVCAILYSCVVALVSVQATADGHDCRTVGAVWYVTSHTNWRCHH